MLGSYKTFFDTTRNHSGLASLIDSFSENPSLNGILIIEDPQSPRKMS